MAAQSAIAGAWSPLRHPTYRGMWLAALGSNTGTWMHTVGAAWLMTTLTPSPLLVALVQTATTLPVFLLGLPAGAAADLVDRRRVLLFTQAWMLATAATLGVLTLGGWIGPGSLLGLTFALGLGTAMNAPAWAAAVPEQVPRDELPAAVALNSVGFNIARAVGPALGGLIVAVSSPGIVFLLNASSFVGVISVLRRWQPAPRNIGGLTENPGEGKDFTGAMRAGLRYVWHSPAYHAVLLRSGAFALAASGLWAMLPVVAVRDLGTGSAGYGTLLACLGIGSVTGAAILAPLRPRYSADRMVEVGAILFALATLALALLRSFPILCAAMFVGGAAWITVMASFNVAAQTAPPVWVRARALAVYLLVFQGAMALGATAWGALAARAGVREALAAAAVAIVLGLTLRGRLAADRA